VIWPPSIAAALLLPARIARAWPAGATLTGVLAVAAIDLQAPSPVKAGKAVTQDTLFGVAEQTGAARPAQSLSHSIDRPPRS
jgi:hypothetical protein